VHSLCSVLRLGALCRDSDEQKAILAQMRAHVEWAADAHAALAGEVADARAGHAAASRVEALEVRLQVIYREI